MAAARSHLKGDRRRIGALREVPDTVPLQKAGPSVQVRHVGPRVRIAQQALDVVVLGKPHGSTSASKMVLFQKGGENYYKHPASMI